jgi:hypothetical protein
MTPTHDNRPTSRLPSLGRRGEGWVAGQLLLTAADLKARGEEVWLRERLDGYETYRAQTPGRIVPFIY